MVKALKQLEEIDLKSVFSEKRFEKWLERYPILNNEDVYKWIINKVQKFTRNNKEPQKFNVSGYLRPLQNYCDYNDADNPSLLLKENIDLRNSRLIEYLKHLLDNGVKESSVKNAYQSRIKSFYSARGSPITDGYITIDSITNEFEIILNRDMIQSILNRIPNQNYKLAIKCQSLLGLRVSDVLEELISKNKSGKAKYKIQYHDGSHYYIQNFITRKENVIIRFLFFPKELTKLIQNIYLIDDLTKLDLSESFLRTKTGKPIIASEYRRAIKKATKDLFPNKIMKTHSFRKFFYTSVGRVDLTETNKKIGTTEEFNFKEHLVGHKVHYSSNTYNQLIAQKDKFFELWRPLEKEICVNCEIIDKTNEEIKKLKETNKELKSQLSEIIEYINFEKQYKSIDWNIKETKEKIESLTDKIEIGNLEAEIEAYEEDRVKLKQKALKVGIKL